MRPPCAPTACLGSVLAAGALLALAAPPGVAKAGPDRPGARAERFADGSARGFGGVWEWRRMAQAQGPGSDAAPGGGSGGEVDSALKWLRYSSERFRTLMRMLAAKSSRYQARLAAEAKREAEVKAAEEARRAEEVKQAAEAEVAAEKAKREAEASAAEAAKREAEVKAAEEARRADEARRAAEAKRDAEVKAAEEARRVEEAKRAAEAKAAAEKTRREAEAKAAEEARRAEEAKRVAEAKAAAEKAKREAEANAAEEARLVEQAKGAAVEKAKQEAEPAVGPKQAAMNKRRRRLAPCRNAGVKVKGAGWYVVQVGDTLWGIARVHYGSGRTYRRIHAANWRAIRNPNRIYPCQRIYIPRSRAGDAPVQEPWVALAPFIRRRAIDSGLPGLAG